MGENLLKIHMGLGGKGAEIEDFWQKKKKIRFGMMPNLKTFE